MFRDSVKSTGYPLRQFLLHFPSRASPCAITFQLDSTKKHRCLTALEIEFCMVVPNIWYDLHVKLNLVAADGFSYSAYVITTGCLE